MNPLNLLEEINKLSKRLSLARVEPLQTNKDQSRDQGAALVLRLVLLDKIE
jgi:hypothetical protein